jgi:hypothetical protein
VCAQLLYQCWYFEPCTLRDLARIDVRTAFEHFNSSFRNPREFTLCFTGSLKVGAV